MLGQGISVLGVLTTTILIACSNTVLIASSNTVTSGTMHKTRVKPALNIVSIASSHYAIDLRFTKLLQCFFLCVQCLFIARLENIKNMTNVSAASILEYVCVSLYVLCSTKSFKYNPINQTQEKRVTSESMSLPLCLCAQCLIRRTETKGCLQNNRLQPMLKVSVCVCVCVFVCVEEIKESNTIQEQMPIL